MADATSCLDGNAGPLVIADGNWEFNDDAEGDFISQVCLIDSGEISLPFLRRRTGRFFRGRNHLMTI